MTTGYERAFHRSIERIADALEGIDKKMAFIVEKIEAESGPQTDWDRDLFEDGECDSDG